MRFLTICEGGNVRSVGLAYLLKNNGQQALACGWRYTDAETLAMLLNWCDYAVVMQDEFRKYIPIAWLNKLRVVDVGPDVFGSPFHPNLQGFLYGVVSDWATRSYQI